MFVKNGRNVRCASQWAITIIPLRFVKFEERRFSSRVNLPYAARVWGLGEAGRRLKEDTVVDNIGTGGLYLHLKNAIPEGTQVYVAARIAEVTGGPGLLLAASGLVVRSEPQPDGTCGLAVEFTRRRIF